MYEVQSCAVSGSGSSEILFSKGQAERAFPSGTLTMSFTKGSLSGKLISSSDQMITSVSVTGRLSVPSRSAFLKNGFQSWSYSGALGPDDAIKRSPFYFANALQENVLNIPSGKKGIHISELFCFAGSDKEGILAAQNPPFCQYLSFIFNAKSSELTITWDLGKVFRKGEAIPLDPVMFTQGECSSCLSAWTDDVVRKEKLKFNHSMRTGWCSWYYYYTKISADIILENLRQSKKRKIPFDFFQIDDGYQRAVGDWLHLTQGFDGRMNELTDEIRKAGYTPGIWIAPFITTKKAPSFSKPGWVLRDDRGKPVVAGWNPNWGSAMQLPFYALDITHPEVKEYIREVISTVSKSWGFPYLKLDFLYAASLPGQRYDMSVTRAEVLREGLELIRESAGKKAILLGCGLPLSAALGTVDAMRVSCDVSPRWNVNPVERLLHSDSNLETRGAIRNSLVRAFMDKRFWINDPDCLMLRTVNTKLSEAERRSLYNAVMTTGGMVVTSDDLSLYGKKETEDLTRALSLFKKNREGKVSAPDILEKKIPEFLWNEKGFLSVFNFGESSKEIVISRSALAKKGIKAKTLTDVETGEAFDIREEISFRLEAHDSRMFSVK